MDVSIAVSLIRGQMGAVVERAVNGAVETVLAEMLKVVGVKFEELKAQVAVLKRDMSGLQREKSLKEKENDKIRAMLRYTELKLKYYRQGVEEEMQQRAGSAVHRIHQAAPGSGSTQTKREEGAAGRTGQERGAAQRKEEEEDECEWTISFQPHTEDVDPALAPPTAVAPPPALPLEPEQASLSPDESTQADSSTLLSTTPQVKQEEVQQQEEEEEEVICIKEEPEEEQEVMATLLLDCQIQQGQLPGSEGQRSVEWSGLPVSQRNFPDHSTAFSSAGPCSYSTPQPLAPLPSVAPLPPGAPPRQAVRPWTNDLSLYEEYKLRRNELRRRSLNRRREMEKTLPQPLLADLVRERREKTRLRVARWRAKRKLQACLSQAQAPGGAAGFSQQPGFTFSSQHQQFRACASTSSSQQRRSSPLPQCSSFLNNNNNNNSSGFPASLPFIAPSSSSSSPSLLLGGHNMAEHVNQHAVTSSSSSSSSSYPQVSLPQQSVSLTDEEFFQ
ncbi:uncharacterized protein [Centroberyx affinis]|uniref:uncharacterized protein isoform X2 n=1 Tax=Centroberyx affinis TaxID=166261 RepID=UPI003A5C1210